ncbi:MAG: cobyrinate a,c-diamide synthase [Desulfitobacteriaceae bacterium]|nr:cobyrinate a,c-diamide synthase [Clostridia bacterium]MDD4346156.1 cobyrinate a,c-diamide synthase [Desulfitobacteriaceae bacterium]MDD4400621.1 cobyrinate a,c-diamide synthase [Desulfitobacteriaceae bacterium]
MNFPRLVIAGTQSGVGKTTIATGLMAALTRNRTVQPFKVGPDYIDPAYHTYITGRYSRNLDGWMLDADAVAYLFYKNMAGADIAVIEGVMGLFDGAENGADNGSTAQIAKILRAPVVLVVDAGGMATSAAALVQGYHRFDPGLQLAGIVINNVGGEGHYCLVKETIENYTGIRVFGYLSKNAGIKWPERQLGLVPSGELADLKEKIQGLAALVEETVEVDALLKLAETWSQNPPAGKVYIPELYPPNTVPVAVAYDEAFNFYYRDNLDLLIELGAEIRFFSPRTDRSLPEGVAGLILGGGFPEVFAAELQENISMKTSIKDALTAGVPYYAECGGLMYLAESLVDFQDNNFSMVGWLKGECRMTSRLQRFGYAYLELEQDCMWGEKGEKIRIHEFHHSQACFSAIPTVYSLTKQRRDRITQEWRCGFQQGNGIAGYAHLHFYSNLDFACNFLAFLHSHGQCGEKVPAAKKDWNQCSGLRDGGERVWS